jgi:tetratricopeptide (TPR) repeat protein
MVMTYRGWTWLASSLLALAGCSSGSPAKTPSDAQAGSKAAAKRSAAAEEASAAKAAPAPRPAMNPPAARAYAAGQASFQQGDLNAAEKSFAEAARLDHGAYLALHALGVVRERLGNSAGALEAYAGARAVVADYGPAILSEVNLLLALGREQQAEDLARGLMARQPESAAVLTAFAEVRSVRKDSTSAQQMAQQALKKDPDFRPAMVTLARDHYRARRLDLALYTLTAILDGYGTENPPRDKNNAEARYLRALIFREQNKRAAAIDELKKVVQLRPDLVQARLYLAAYMLEAGNADEARPLLEDALKYDASNVLVHLNLGDAYRLLGKPKDALEHLEWVARRDPNMAQTHYNLGLVYLFSQNVPGATEKQAIEKAIEAFERYKKLSPRSGRGAGDDVDELLARARNKKSIIEALEETPAENAAQTGGAG